MIKAGSDYNLKDALNLISFVDKNYGEQTIVKSKEHIETLPVKMSTISKYEILLKGNAKKFLANDYDETMGKCVYRGKKEISFINKKKYKFRKCRLLLWRRTHL